MTMILGCDIATNTGLAWYDTKAHVSAIRTQKLRAIGDAPEEKAASLGREFMLLLKERKGTPHFPAYVVIEQPMRVVKAHTKKASDWAGETTQTINPSTAFVLNQLAAAIVTVCACYRVPWSTVSVATWRNRFLDGPTRGMKPADLKKAVRAKCGELGVKVKNNDEADAVGVALCAPRLQHYRSLYG